MESLKLPSIPHLLVANLFLRLTGIRLAGIHIGRGSWLKCSTEIGVGSGIGWNFCVRGSGKVVIGKYCAIGENVRIITSNHETTCLALNYNLQSKLTGRRMAGEKLDVVIGNDVWIGDGAIILPGTSIGNGAIVGAGAVVTKSVAPFTVVAGNPAKVIRKRFSPEVIDEVSNLNWWNWSSEKMKEKRDLFQKRF